MESQGRRLEVLKERKVEQLEANQSLSQSRVNLALFYFLPQMLIFMLQHQCFSVSKGRYRGGCVGLWSGELRRKLWHHVFSCDTAFLPSSFLSPVSTNRRDWFFLWDSREQQTVFFTFPSSRFLNRSCLLTQLVEGGRMFKGGNRVGKKDVKKREKGNPSKGEKDAQLRIAWVKVPLTHNFSLERFYIDGWTASAEGGLTRKEAVHRRNTRISLG